MKLQYDGGSLQTLTHERHLGEGVLILILENSLKLTCLSQGWVLEFAHSRLEPRWSVWLWYSLNNCVIHFMWWHIFWMAKLYHKDRWWLLRRANWYYVEAWTTMMTHSHGGLLPHWWQSLSLDFLMHSLWWQVFWIFALSTPCGSFTTKIVEGPQMNMILDRLVVAKKQLDAAFKLELTPCHSFPYLVGCVSLPLWRMVGQDKLTLWCISCDDKSSEYLPWARNAEALPPRSLRVCRWTWFWIAWLSWRNGLMPRRSLNWHHIIHFHT